MFKINNNGAFGIIHPITRVEWIEYTIEKAIARYAFLRNLTFREALLVFERS